MANKRKKPANKKEEKFGALFSTASDASSRSSYRLSTTVNSNLKAQLGNIDEGILPYQTDQSGIGVTDSILLCQKAYFNVSIFRNTIDIQTEFSNSKLHFKGGSDKSRNFFEAWWKKINGVNLAEQFFRERYRSSNFFGYKTYFEIKPDDLAALRDEYGSGNIPSSLMGKRIPLRYVVLNPTEIKAGNNSSFINSRYFKLLNTFELQKLKKPTTQEEKEFLNSLPKETRDDIKAGKRPMIPLDSDKLVTSFAKKQDYEPLAVPMYYPVLFDINLKLQFKKVDNALARTVDYSILLVKMGDKDDGVNPKVMETMKNLFTQETVNRVVVADWTTEMEFIIPDLNKVLGPTKYEVVNRDIANGLMNIFFEDQKFANGFIKTKIFLERLKDAQNAFINDFLIKEMEEIADELSLRDIPTPVFEEIDLNEQSGAERVYTRLAELGFLTPDEFFEVTQSGIYPTAEKSEEDQKKFKAQKDKGLYEPLIGGPKDPQQNGRPPGSKAPQTTKKVSPQKSVGSEEGKFNFSKIKDVALKMSDLVEKVEKSYKEKNALTRLSHKHKALAYEIAQQVAMNEDIKTWDEVYGSYLESPLPIKEEISQKINEIASELSLDYFSAALLMHSKNL